MSEQDRKHSYRQINDSNIQSHVEYACKKQHLSENYKGRKSSSFQEIYLQEADFSQQQLSHLVDVYYQTYDSLLCCCLAPACFSSIQTVHRQPHLFPLRTSRSHPCNMPLLSVSSATTRTASSRISRQDLDSGRSARATKKFRRVFKSAIL
ncbi:uncharacterized protein LOC110988261 [Acanthaster planci]|uniref:Uncharacterized protein LOC110988261 n=1 Tax=Acanthaster planci TaxID=133434 RepID=A0A8B7ZNX7_ACAPL|nr:uncharacterized protein LOC110988261 [Acanthaster planci]